MHPEIAFALIQARLADLRKYRGPAGPPDRTRPGLRDRIGWFLVELGLRIATPRPAPGATAG